MTTQIDIQIHNALVEYLAGKTTLNSFRDWFDEATWTIDESGDPGAQALAGEIELRIAEYLNGHRSELELKGALLPKVRFFSHGLTQSGTTSADNVTVRLATNLAQVVGIRVERVFA